MPQLLTADDPRLSWNGAVSLEPGDDWLMPWRLPFQELALYPFEALHDRASHAAGVRLAFRSDTRSLGGWFADVMGEAKLDLCLDGELVRSLSLEGQDHFEYTELPAGEKLFELWLPQFHPVRLRSLILDEDAALAPDERELRPWVTYGSSITQCRGAASPARTWPALVAREHNLDLTCLGFAGQCHIEPMIARLIRDQPADMISLCLGINVQGGSSLNERTFRPAVLGFIEIVREKHPHTPLAVISPIYAPDREEQHNSVGLNLRIMRAEIEAAVQILHELGDEKVCYVDGLELFGQEHADLLPDDLHPNAEGYGVLARNFMRKVLPRLARSSASSRNSKPICCPE